MLLVFTMIIGLFGYGSSDAMAVSDRAQHVILIIGDGMQLEHERAYNDYLTGAYDSGLEQWNFSYKGAATTWDVTTYNRYAFTAGVPALTDTGFDPQASASFTTTLGYDPAKGGKLPGQNAINDGGAPAGYATGVSYYPGREITYGFDGKGLNAHTNEPVTVYARGAGYQRFGEYEGSWYPGTKLLDNTHIYKVMMGALGLTDENRPR